MVTSQRSPLGGDGERPVEGQASSHLPAPRRVPGQGFSAQALGSLPPPLPAIHLVAVAHTSPGPTAAPQAPALSLLLSALFLPSVRWRLRPALLPALGTPRLSLQQPLLRGRGGGGHVPRVLPLPPSPLPGWGRRGRAGLAALVLGLSHAGLPLLLTGALGGLAGLWRLVGRGLEAPIDLRQGRRGGRAALWV